MKNETANYGVQRGYEARFEDAQTMSLQDERAWSVLAHLSTYLNLVTGFLGPIVAGMIWLLYRDRSEVVASHALRSVPYQVVWLTAIAVGWMVAVALMAVLVGFLLVPVMVLVSLGLFVQAAFEAYGAYRGP